MPRTEPVCCPPAKKQNSYRLNKWGCIQGFNEFVDATFITLPPAIPHIPWKADAVTQEILNTPGGTGGCSK